MDTYIAEHQTSGDGILKTEVRSHYFDPIASLIDGYYTLMALNDSWKQTTSAHPSVRLIDT